MATERITEMKTADKEEIISAIKEKYPNTTIFLTEIPYNGFYAYRPQEMKDVKSAAKQVEEFIEDEINKQGGSASIDKMKEDDKNKFIRKLDLDASEISTNVTLSLCVVYPFDFKKKLNEGSVPAGIGPTLLQKIVEVSGWGDITVDEI